jgi:hypothetical protein
LHLCGYDHETTSGEMNRLELSCEETEDLVCGQDAREPHAMMRQHRFVYLPFTIYHLLIYGDRNSH